jgi:hypothetical protein
LRSLRSFVAILQKEEIRVYMFVSRSMDHAFA